MKIKVERRDLVQALEPISKLARKDSSMEVLSHCLVTASEGKVSIRGTNLDTFMTKIVKAEVGEAGQSTVDTKKLLSMLKADKADIVNLETISSDRIIIETDDISSKFRTLDTNQYPVFDENITFWFDIEPKIFIKDILCVMNAAESGRKANPILETIFVETKDGNLMLSASDAKIILKIRKEIVAENKCTLIPCTFPPILSGGIDGESLVVGTSGENDNLVCFHTDECHISSRVYEGQFPDLDSMIVPYSKKHTTDLMFLRQDMEYMVSIIKPVAVGIDKVTIKMRLEGDKLHIAHRNDSGEISSHISVQDKNGGDFTFFWQLDYMEKLIAGFKQHDEIFLGFTDNKQPVYFKNTGDLVTEGLVMPIANVSWMEDL